jgi:hypothetical protein
LQGVVFKQIVRELVTEVPEGVSVVLPFVEEDKDELTELRRLDKPLSLTGSSAEVVAG